MRWVGASQFEFDLKSMVIEKTIWSEIPNGGKGIVEQILTSEETNKSKRAGLWDSQSGIEVVNLIIWIRSFENENLYQSLSVLSVPPGKVS